ncbi:type II toxin-antitoxin system HicA family toxin [Candidatus Peregrinibacteria bacterium]|nr:type II toxin-antitoxin system HicA family toxin [Candidatus Peregrinibacteria bacterium]
MPRVTGKEMVRFLERQGFQIRRIVGSHHVLRKEDIQAVIPVHKNDDLKTGTLRGILRDVKMEPEEFERLWHE